MTLSKRNYHKLSEHYLYQKDPIINESYSNVFHCKNWTFKVVKRADGRAYMYDTYFFSWDSHTIQVTDDNINEFKVVFDFREVKKINDSEADEYNEEDRYRVATDSGGYSCGHLYWAKKDAEKSHELLIKKTEEKIESLKNQLSWAENNLNRLLGE